MIEEDGFETLYPKPKPLPTRSAVLREADGLINGERQKHYGTPQENHARIAKGWEVILKTSVTPDQVALCMAWLKIARLAEGPHRDSYVDGAAYMALAAELALD